MRAPTHSEKNEFWTPDPFQWRHVPNGRHEPRPDLLAKPRRGVLTGGESLRIFPKIPSGS
jgi:hypothetical protein